MISVVTGIIAGAVHVWSGPDHLAAVAPLAVSRRAGSRAWLPGVRWGLGHSAGVALIGFLSLWLRDLLPLERISFWGERLIGVMLFGIGLWALRKALQHTVHVHEHEHDGERHAHFHTHTHRTAHESIGAHRHTHAAFGIGTLHGLAGSSHFFAVLPSLALPTTAQAVAYLVAYGVGTVISMATFSWLLGWVTTRFALGSVKVYRGLLGVCAATAMGVGCFWLAASWR